ncbi:MAG: hypothetical protein JNM55_18015 [Anaerolineales bacterium]|nr:hypothetical protein [Anaerolineales bacterium]
MNAKGNNSIKESKAIMSASVLMRLAGVSAMLAGVSAMLAGLCFIIIGMFHPENVPSSVTTTIWVNVHIVATALGFFGLFGMAGLYARQVEKSGWMGLTGFILLSIWFVLITGFSFVEAFILPHLAAESPAFVESLLGMFTGVPSTVDLGVLPMLWNISGPMFILGPLLFGVATLRAHVLPRWAGGLLTLAAVLIPIGGMFPHEYQAKIAMIPIGLAMTWLGTALFSERREKASEVVPGKVISQLSQTEAK